MYVHVSVIMCILIWIHVHVSVTPLIVVSTWPIAGDTKLLDN